MNVYLPIAEISLNLFTLIGLGAAVGVLSGLFGVGGGFIATPLLIVLGVPAPVAVATQANQIIATSVSGALAHWQRGTIDFEMAGLLLAGGTAGSSGGVWLFGWLQEIGQIDIVIRLSFVALLNIVGGLMLWESVRAAWRRRRRRPPARRRHYWIHALPFKMKFRRSGLYVSALLPVTIGGFIGLLVAIMGVGGGFIMVPALIYILGMPSATVVGTSLFQIIFVAANTTMLQAVTNHTVDIVLALVMMLGGTVGAQYGTRFGHRLNAESLRILMAVLVLGMGLKMAYDVTATPAQPYSLIVAE